jgi:PhzF family phenazine biosynthesis protein
MFAQNEGSEFAQIPIFQVDAFTKQPFSGNPAAVCVLPSNARGDWMQQVAQEMNLSETAFLYPEADGNEYRLRWFTPTSEVDLCGHATLASAHVLWSFNYLHPEEVARFQTRSGSLTAVRKEGWIELNFPTTYADAVPAPSGLSDALGTVPQSVWKNRSDYLVEVESEAILRQLKPRMALLQQLPMRGLIVTSAASSEEYDFICRFFAPAVGIDEDPVTGSAFCTLAPFWGDRLQKSEFVAYQASARGGVVRLRWQGERTYISGQAVTVLQGVLMG